MIRKLCLIGVGLIGGSIAKALRASGQCLDIIGADADSENLDRALEKGVIDVGFDSKIAGNCAKAAQGADWVVLAMPVGASFDIFSDLKPVWSQEAIYTDVGSIKQGIVSAAERVFGKIPANFVPGHPIAGAERSGVDAARAELFRDKRVILTPMPVTSPDAVQSVHQFWTSLGASVSLMEPLHHDQVFAATSHLPHILAYALVHMLGRMDEQEEIFQYAGAGFRDFTRIASSNALMWRDICQSNSEQIVPLLLSMGNELKQVAGLMKLDSVESAEKLLAYFAESRNARQRFLEQTLPSKGSS